MIKKTCTIDSAGARDLPKINRVISAAINAWTVSDRVKRLALPLYHYDQADLEDLHIEKSLDTHGTILGVIAWGAVGPEDTLGRAGEAVLHGIYVEPAFQGLGVGKALLEHAVRHAAVARYRGFIIKASKDAVRFFEQLGCIREEDAPNAYPYLFWLPFQNSVNTAAAGNGQSRHR
jgi:GNAT superfamily N-acetyltransferase